MPQPDEQPIERRFLRVDDAEIAHGPDVIADKVSRALRDADRYDVPTVKPPLSQALDAARRAGRPAEAAESEPPAQDALSCTSAEIDAEAGSEEALKPDPDRQP